MFHTEYHRTTVVQDENYLEELYRKATTAKFNFWDTETSGLKVRVAGNDFVVGWTIAFEDEVSEDVYYLPVGHYYEGVYTPHIDMDKLKKRKEDYPDFDEKEWVGKEYRNLDAEKVTTFIRKLFELPLLKVAHNQSFDMHVLQNEGIPVNLIYRDYNFDDSMVMVHTAQEEEEKKLEKLVERAYGIKKSDYKDTIATITAEERKELGRTTIDSLNFSFVQIPIAAQYSGEDVYFMKSLYPDLKEMVQNDDQWDYYRNMRIPFLLVLWNMEREGAFFDKEGALEMQRKAEKVLEDIKAEIAEIVGLDYKQFNITSKQHLYELLHGHKKQLKDKKTGEYRESFNEHIVEKSYGFPILEWTDGGKEKDKKLKTPKMDKDAMESILSKQYKDKHKIEGQRIVQLLMRYNKLNKLYGTYMVGMVDLLYSDGKIHPSFNQCGTSSHRISCEMPNLLNLPRPLEKPKEPKRHEDMTDAEFIAVKKEYAEAKEEYDFWIQFEIRSLITSGDESEILVVRD